MCPEFLRDYRPGKATIKGVPQKRPSFDVTAVFSDEALDFFGCRDRAELLRHVRGLHDLGLLLRTRPERLTSEVRTDCTNAKGWPTHRHAYLLLCSPEEVPRRKRARRPRGRVYTW